MSTSESKRILGFVLFTWLLVFSPVLGVTYG